MGNVVAGEALRLAAQNGDGTLVNTYVASQAAIPAHVYDATVTAPYLIDFTHTSSKIPNWVHWQSLASYGPYTPNVYGNRLTNNAVSVGRRISFYNVNDYALSPDAWCFDQAIKPDKFVGSGYYSYAGGINDPSPWNNFEYEFYATDPPVSPNNLDIVNNQDDRYKVLAYAAQPRSTALGATPVGTLKASVNMTDPSNDIWPSLDPLNNEYKSHFWHSAQFRGDAWLEWNYWQTLLRSSTIGFNINN